MRRIPTGLLLFALSTAVAVVAVAQDEPQAECAAPRFSAQLMTPIAGRIPRDASLVVGLFHGGTLAELPSTLQLSRRRRSVALTSAPIAPGLYRVTPEAGRIYGRYTLDGVEGSPELLFARPGLPAPPTQPRVERLERYRAVSGGESHTELKAHFDFPIPAGVVAAVAYFGDDDAPDLWARAIPTQTQAVLWRSTGRCSQLPPGATEPPREGDVRIAFVDQYGQMSQRSAPAALAR